MLLLAVGYLRVVPCLWQNEGQIAKESSKWAVGKAPPVLGSPLAVHCTTRSEGRRPFHVNECSDVVKHIKVLCKVKIKIVETYLNAYLKV